MVKKKKVWIKESYRTNMIAYDKGAPGGMIMYAVKGHWRKSPPKTKKEAKFREQALKILDIQTKKRKR